MRFRMMTDVLKTKLTDFCIAHEPAGCLSNEEIGYFMEGAFEVLNRIPEADMKEYCVYSYHFCTYDEYMDEIFPEHIRETGLLTSRAVHLVSVPQSRYYTDDGTMIECGYDVVYDINNDRIMLLYYIITANRDFTTIYRTETDKFDGFCAAELIIELSVQVAAKLKRNLCSQENCGKEAA